MSQPLSYLKGLKPEPDKTFEVKIVSETGRLTLDGYQDECNQTAVFENKTIGGLEYCALKLAGEAGEFAEKIGKLHRDHNGVLTPEITLALIKEAGDVLWYVGQISRVLGFDLSETAQINLDKVLGRLERGTIHGDGDDR